MNDDDDDDDGRGGDDDHDDGDDDDGDDDDSHDNHDHDYDDDADDDDCDCCCGLRGFQYALQSCPYGMSTSILVAAVATFLAAISSPVQVKLMMPTP